MRRPGPLQDFPLELFLPPNPNLPGNAKFKPNKRPLSPGQPSLYSPAKRRILNEEGIFSSEKVLKSPLSSSRERASPTKFADALRGPNSPAKKLDFGLPKNYAESSRCSSMPSSSRDLTSPDQQPTSSTSPAFSPQPNVKNLAIKSFRNLLDHGETQEMDDYFSSPRLPVAIPRALPPPQTAHYPGFMIHHDTEGARSPSIESDVPMSDSCSDTETDKDGQKENIAPRKRARKLDTPPPSTSVLNPMQETERHGKARSTPATPKKNPLSIGAREGPITPTPRRPGSDVKLMFPSPEMTPVVREKARLERRRVLEVEVDGVRGEDEAF